MVMKKEIVGNTSPSKISMISDLWNKKVEPISIKRYSQETADTEKMILFGETGTGKTRFYLDILRYLQQHGLTGDQLLMCIVYPDRPKGLTSLYGLIPKEYQECVKVFPAKDYEDMIISTATSVGLLEEHFKKTGVHGWLVCELMETYWTYSMDYYCRMAYGESMGDYFAQMQSVLSKEKSTQGAAFEAFAGPFGGPWPIIKLMHNFNWIDKLKRMNFNMVFTSEIKQEENKDSIFSELGVRPAGEKHMMHKFDTILYMSHKGNTFSIKPFKLTGYEKLYGQQDITAKSGYEVHCMALKRLEDMGLKTTKMEDLEKEAGITPPKLKEKIKPTVEISMNKQEPEKEVKTEEPKKEEQWNF